jgi:signal transduction histidine kinase
LVTIAYLEVSLPILGKEMKDMVIIRDKNELLLIGKKTFFLEDKHGILTFDDIQSPRIQAQFQLSDRDAFTRPVTKSAFWFKIQVQNQCEEDIWLEVGTTLVWYIDFYKPDSLGHYQLYETGTFRPKNNKFYDVNWFWLPLNKAHDTQTKTYYLKIWTKGGAYEAPLSVGTIRSLIHKKGINDYIVAGFVGLMSIMLIYNGFLYFSTKERIYSIYSGYVFANILLISYLNGYPVIQEIFFFVPSTWWKQNFLLWQVPITLFSGWFCIYYLKLRRNFPLAYKTIIALLFLLCVAYPILNILEVSFVVLFIAYQISITTLAIIALISSFYLAKKGFKQARFYVVGWTFYIISAFVFIGVINGFIDYNPFTRNAICFGVALEICMFSLALGDRLNLIRKEKQEILLENLHLVREQRNTLEEKVISRTAEIEKSKEELRTQSEQLQNALHSLELQAIDLAKSNATKDKLFSIIAHDIRSPLGSIYSVIELIRNQEFNQETQEEVLSDASKQIHLIFNFVDDLLLWSKSQMENFVLQSNPIYIKEIVDEVTPLLNLNAKNHHVSIENQIPENLQCQADLPTVKIVLNNLIKNALNASKDGGSVIIQGRKIESSFVEISIIDSGIGMTKEKMSNLFNPNLNNNRAGGIGLLLCKDFVEKNDGKIWVESQEGQGSRFLFTLPQ